MTVLCAALWGCNQADRPAGSATPDATVATSTTTSSSSAAPATAPPAPGPDAGYPCPSLPATWVDAAIDPASGLKVGFRVPAGFVPMPPSATSAGGVLSSQGFQLPFEHTGVNRYRERLWAVVVEHGPALPQTKAPPVPAQTVPYAMGSGADDDASLEVITQGKAFQAGEVSINGQTARILRDPGRETVRFRVRLSEGEGAAALVRDLMVSVSIARVNPITVTDPTAEACVAAFDRLGLAVAQSLKAL